MPCIRIGNAFVCGPRTYQYNGWYFEVHSYCGPWPLKKNGDPHVRAGRKFFKDIDGFLKLSNKKQRRYEV